MRNPTAMELRVAAALAERAGLVPDEGAIARHLADARAAIRAMRGQTVEILEAMRGMAMYHAGYNSGHWERLIDAASPPDSDA